jgi:hypothetical protein
LDSDSDKDESEEDDIDEDKVNSALDVVREKLLALYDEKKRATEVVSSAESRLKFLDAHGNSLDRKRGVDIETSVETYRKEREKVFKDHMDGSLRERELTTEISKLQREEARLERVEEKEEAKAAKARAKVQRAKAKLREKEQRREAERKKEKARIRKERESFWPRSCYSVRITLDAASFTPGSSRRSSIASATDVKVVADKELSKQEGESATSSTCELTLSYVTSSAFWSPSYDLSLSTTTNTAMLCFDAQLTNTTSETWTNSKVTLSTSQANFSGLQDDTPSLTPWRLQVVGRGGPWNGVDIVHSREEVAEKKVWNAAQNAIGQQKPRSVLFGVSQGLPAQQMQLMQLQQQQQMRQMQSMQPQQQHQQQLAQLAAQPMSNATAFGNVGGSLAPPAKAMAAPISMSMGMTLRTQPPIGVLSTSSSNANHALPKPLDTNIRSESSKMSKSKKTSLAPAVSSFY